MLACLPLAYLSPTCWVFVLFACLLTCIRSLFDILLVHQSAKLAKGSCFAGG